ncbi:MAG: kinase [Microlunatus sp.]
MEAVGSPDTRLILLRGNSASGKSSLARSIRASRPRGIAVIGQDQLRREILHAREEPGNPTIGYIDLSARYALDQGLHVIVEGILYAHIYGAMLTELLRDHRGISRCYRYEIPFEETARRHTSKPEAAAYGPEMMQQWWRDSDPLPGMEEQVLGPEVSLANATAQILADCGWRPDTQVHNQARGRLS